MVSEQQLNDDEAERIMRFVFKLRGEGDYPSAKAWERELHKIGYKMPEEEPAPSGPRFPSVILLNAPGPGSLYIDDLYQSRGRIDFFND